MRKQLFLILILLGTVHAFCQQKQLLYDLRSVPQALLLNPGMQHDFQWYAGIPMLSGISAYGGSSGIAVNDIFAADGLDFTTKIRDNAVYNLTKRDEFSSTYQVEVFNLGWRGRNRPQNFYSMGLYHEGGFILYWPQDLAILAFEGNADQLGRRFSLEHLKTRGDFLNVFHIGLNRTVNEELSIGVRGKLYSGMLSYSSIGNSGYFVTEQGQNNLRANTIVADMALRTSGWDRIREVLDDDSIDDLTGIRQHLIKRAFLGGDLGVGLDLGFSYNLNPQTTITGSILDIGLMYHAGDPFSYTLKGSATVEGIEVILPDALLDPDADFWQNLVDDIEGIVPFGDNRNSYISFRPTQLYASLRYDFGQPGEGLGSCDCDYRNPGRKAAIYYRNAVGGQLYMINRPRGPQAALTAFYQRRFGNTLTLKATYTASKFTYTNLGAGISAQAGPVNFYLMADNLLALRDVSGAQYASFQLGLNIISWGRNN
ncbi:DUF5723 family protein [Zeaxanthinibacter enoshimensis]|uniref:DUF5723 domain-containing protein n=1 Tax=Zeaxanthinibacter enoshimensis TaxID=392009 RepID=A0A4R6TIJ0_9FLAO|nr:DUF5723 family protein [Zeaxanthinibacter enoshimensis]TDQ28979.1 hypothetical protein CLV82_2428 [Zeaxanthinibacter enoshimensis]